MKFKMMKMFLFGLAMLIMDSEFVMIAILTKIVAQIWGKKSNMNCLKGLSETLINRNLISLVK